MGVSSKIKNYLKEIVYGGNDGIITTFAVVAGFYGAQFDKDTTLNLSFSAVLLFGFANLFADALSMGIGDFLSERSSKDLHLESKKKINQDFETNENLFTDKTKSYLESKGFSSDKAHEIIQLYKENTTYWKDFLAVNIYNRNSSELKNPFVNAFATFSSFILFGFIPLIPFILLSNSEVQFVFLVSSISTFGALILLGFIKGFILNSKILYSIVEVAGLGSIAAAVAFLVGITFNL